MWKETDILVDFTDIFWKDLQNVQLTAAEWYRFFLDCQNFNLPNSSKSFTELYISLWYCLVSSASLAVCLRGRIGWIIIKMILSFIFPPGWTILTLVIHGILNAVQPSAQKIYICLMKLMTFMCKSASGLWHFTNKSVRIIHIMCKASIFHQDWHCVCGKM